MSITVPLTCGNNVTNQNFTNTKILCISGYKKDSCSNVGITGWTITLTNSTPGFSVTQTTDASGKYQFCNLAAGSYTLTEETRSGWKSTSPVSITVPLTCGNNVTNQNFTNTKILCISGYKKDSCTNVGITGWTITLTNSTPSFSVTQTTDASGKYQFCNLAAGSYTLTEETRSGWKSTSPVSITVPLTCGNNVTNQNFTNTKILCISGYKKDSCNNVGITGWTITLTNSTPGFSVTQTTDASGKYQFCNLAADLTP